MKIKNVSPATHDISDLKPGDVCSAGETRGIVLVCVPKDGRSRVVNLVTGEVHVVPEGLRVRPLKAILEVDGV